MKTFPVPKGSVFKIRSPQQGQVSGRDSTRGVNAASVAQQNRQLRGDQSQVPSSLLPKDWREPARI